MCIRDRLDEERLLRDAVGGVRLLGIPVPEILLAERDRGELRVGADRTEHHALLYTLLPGGLDQLDAHDRVVVKELPRVRLVEADPADLRGQVDDNIFS